MQQNFMTIEFSDSLGGHWKFLDKPTRRADLEKRLKSSIRQYKKHDWKKETVLCSTYGEYEILSQARWYSDHVKSSKTKTLYFFDGNGRYSNIFKHEALLGVLRRNFGLSQLSVSSQIFTLEKRAIDDGFKIITVPLSEYMPKLYKPEIKAQTEQLELEV